MRALNSSGVLDETTEEGRLFHSGSAPLFSHIQKSAFINCSTIFWRSSPVHYGSLSEIAQNGPRTKSVSIAFIGTDFSYFYFYYSSLLNNANKSV